MNSKLYTFHKAKIETDENVLIMTGAALGDSIYINNIDKLLNYANVILIHYPGAYESPRFESLFTLEELAEYFHKELVDKLNIKNYSIIGNCMGGGIAQFLSLKYPDFIKKIILVGTSYGSYQRLLINEHLHYIVSYKRLASYLFSKDFIKNNNERIREAFAEFQTCGLTKDDTAPQCYAAYYFSTIKEISEIKTPTLVVHGSLDETIPLKIGKKLAEALPNSRFLEIPDAGHTPLFERPEYFDDVISFLFNDNSIVGEELNSDDVFSEEELTRDDWFREYRNTKDFIIRVAHLYGYKEGGIIDKAIKEFD